MHVRNKMLHLTRILMGHNMEDNRIKVMVKDEGISQCLTCGKENIKRDCP